MRYTNDEEMARLDKLARETTIKGLSKRTKFRYESYTKDKYAVDIIVWDGEECIGYVECEALRDWTYSGKYLGLEDDDGKKMMKLWMRKEHFLKGKDYQDKELPYGPKPVMFSAVSADGKFMLFYSDRMMRDEGEYKLDSKFQANRWMLPIGQCVQIGLSDMAVSYKVKRVET